MRRGYNGGLIAESKEEASELLSKNFDGVIRVQELPEKNISQQTIYDNFSGVEAAEKYVFGEREYTCEECSQSFEKRHAYQTHISFCGSENEEKQRAKSMLSDFDTSGFCVYMLELEGEDGEDWWYVGESKALVERLKHHIKYGVPTKRFGEFEIKKVVKVEKLESKQEAQERERELLFETCIQKETTNLIGGR